jgi:NAD-dependent DNA ligase
MKKKHAATCQEQCCIGITGKLQTMTQDTAIRLIHEAGCAFAFTVGPGTTCLIVGKNPSGQDMMTAERFNICLVWEEQFAEKVTLPHCGKEREKIIEVSD